MIPKKAPNYKTPPPVAKLGVLEDVGANQVAGLARLAVAMHVSAGTLGTVAVVGEDVPQ